MLAKAKVEELLKKLISVQDDITHLNEASGNPNLDPEHATFIFRSLREKQKERGKIQMEIMSIVGRLCNRIEEMDACLRS